MPFEELLLVALKKISSVRDYNAVNGEYPEDTVKPGQCFDDWAADFADKTVKTYRMMCEEDELQETCYQVGMLGKGAQIFGKDCQCPYCQKVRQQKEDE